MSQFRLVASSVSFCAVFGSVVACEKVLSPAADRLLSPIVFHRTAAQLAAQDGQILEASPHTALVEKHFYLLLNSKDVGAVEALAAINRINLGEWYGPVIYCEMVKHRTAIIREITAFTKCVPRGRSWSLPANLTLDAQNASTKLQNLRANVKCSLE